MSFHIEIITPERKAYEEEVDGVSVPTPDGTIGVLSHHVALFSSLSDGEIKIKKDNREFFLAIGGGFMEVTGNHVSILVSRALHADELNEAQIKKAETAAHEILTKKVKGVEYATAQAVLRRSLLELKVLRRHKTRYSSSMGIH